MTGTEITSALTLLTGMVSSLFSVFTTFPLNLVLVGGLSGIAFGIVRKAKGVAKG